MPQKKLTPTQQRVLKWLHGGWEANAYNESIVEINGKKVCNIDTMTNLLKRGLIEKSGERSWTAKKCKTCQKPRKLNENGNCEDCQSIKDDESRN